MHPSQLKSPEFIPPEIPHEETEEMFGDVHEGLLGYDIVDQDIYLQQREVEAAAALEKLREREWAEQIIGEKVDPRTLNRAQRIGRRATQTLGLAMPMMTPDELLRYRRAIRGLQSTEELRQLQRDVAFERLDLEVELDEMRHDLGSVSGDLRERMGKSIGSLLEDEQLNEYEEWSRQTGEIGDASFVTWLTQDRRAKYLTDAYESRNNSEFTDLSVASQDRIVEESQRLRREDNARMLTFLHTNHRHIRDRQESNELRESVLYEKYAWREGVELGVSEGWLDESAMERAKKVHKLKVFVGDDFSTYVHRIMGYFQPSSNEVVVDNETILSQNPEDELNDPTGHEINHALLCGVSAVAEASDSKESTEVVVDPLKNRWVNEALTEHIDQIFKGNSHPEKVNAEVGSYSEERILLVTLVHGMQDLGVDMGFTDFTLAYSATGEKRAALVAELNRKMSMALVGNPDLDILSTIEQNIQQYDNDMQFMPGTSGWTRLDGCVKAVREKLDAMIDLVAE